MIWKTRLFHALPCLAVFALVGCGSNTGSVSGKVTYKKKPFPGGTVTFLDSKQQVKTAPIEADGNYTIEGVAAGPVKISVSPPPPPPKMPMGAKMDPAKMGAPAGAASAAPPTGAKPVSLPQRYQNPEESGLTYTVTKGKQEHNIELK